MQQFDEKSSPVIDLQSPKRPPRTPCHGLFTTTGPRFGTILFMTLPYLSLFQRAKVI